MPNNVVDKLVVNDEIHSPTMVVNTEIHNQADEADDDAEIYLRMNIATDDHNESFISTPKTKAMQNTERARLVRLYRMATLESYIPHSPLPIGLTVLPDRENRWPDFMYRGRHGALQIDPRGKVPTTSVLPLVSWTELNQNLQEQLVARVFILDSRGRVIWNGKWNFTYDKWEDWSLTLYRRNSKAPRAHLNSDGFGWSEIPRLPKLVVGYHGIDAVGALKVRLHKLGMVDSRLAARTYPTVTELRYGVASNVGKKGNVVGWSGRQDTVGVPAPVVHHLLHDAPQWEDNCVRHSVSFEVTDVTKLPSAFVRACRSGQVDAPRRGMQVWNVHRAVDEATYLMNGRYLADWGKSPSVHQKDTDAKFALAVQQYLRAEYVAKRNGGSTQGLHLRYTKLLPAVSDAQLRDTLSGFTVAGVVDNQIIQAIKKEMAERP